MIKYITGDVWDIYSYYDILCITTNGIIKSNGDGVMGAGVALEAAKRFYGIDTQLGRVLKQNGNHVAHLWTQNTTKILSFPTKNSWRDPSPHSLIKQSCEELVGYITDPNTSVLLPFPGTGRGGLTRESVKPILDDILGQYNISVISFT